MRLFAASDLQYEIPDAQAALAFRRRGAGAHGGEVVMKLRDAEADDLESITSLILNCSEQFILPTLTDEGKQSYLQSHSLQMMSERLSQFQYQVIEQDSEIVGVVGMRAPLTYFIYMSRLRFIRKDWADDYGMQPKSKRYDSISLTNSL